jgi:hypothetical protein
MKNEMKKTVKIILPLVKRGHRPNIGFTLWKHNVVNPQIKGRRA